MKRPSHILAAPSYEDPGGIIRAGVMLKTANDDTRVAHYYFKRVMCLYKLTELQHYNVDAMFGNVLTL